MKERTAGLIRELQAGIYDKDTEISLSLLAAVAGESILLLGPPGVAKSMVARRVRQAFKNARGFEYLMSRFSTPDEIFGPVSISKLKDTDSYERCVDGYLPTADVVFLDEIWKAGPAIQNTLLTVMNEKLFRNGNHELHLPLKLLVAASNELPAQGEGLEALWDRFIIRLESRNISTDDLFLKMLTATDDENVPVTPQYQITEREYNQWTKEIDKVTLTQPLLDTICLMRKSLKNIMVDADSELREIYVSDRRWKRITRLLRTSAFLQDRTEADVEDFVPMYHCLWQEPEERDAVRQAVIQAVFATFAGKLADLKEALDKEINKARLARSAGRVPTETSRDFYQEIDLLADNIRETEKRIDNNLFVSAADKKSVKDYLAGFYKEIAFTRQDTGKLYGQ